MVNNRYSKLFKQFRLQRGEKETRDELNRLFDLVDQAFGNIGTIKGEDGVSPVLPPDGPPGADGADGAAGSGGAAGGAGGSGGIGGAGGAGGGAGGAGGAGGDKGDPGDPGPIIATLCGCGTLTDMGSLTQPLWLGNGIDDYFSAPYTEFPTQAIYTLGARNVSAQVKVSVLGVASGGVIFGLTREGTEIADSGSIATPGAAPYSIGPASMGAFNYYSYGIRVRAGTGYTSAYPAATPLVYSYTLTFTS